MIQKMYYFTGFSSSLFACLYFLAISIIIGSITPSTPATASSLAGPRGIAAISLTSHSQSDFADAAKQPEAEKGIKCKTEQGEDVDWFIAYKLPKVRTSSIPHVRDGLAYAFILPSQQEVTVKGQISPIENIKVTSLPQKSKDISGRKSARGQDVAGEHANKTAQFFTKESPKWTLSSVGIDSPQSIVGVTLSQLYVKNNQDVAFLTYNDQPPVGPTISSGGHSKGVILTSLASGGIWIQHSVPHFPLIDLNNSNYVYPATGKNNAQVFHCISLAATKDVDSLANILSITKPHFVNHSFPNDSFKRSYPQLVSLVGKHHNFGYNQSISDLLAGNQSKYVDSEEDPCVNEVNERFCPNKTITGELPNAKVVTPIKANHDIIEIRSAAGRNLRAFVKGPSYEEDIYSSWIAGEYKVKLDVQSWLNGPHPFESNCTSSELSVYNILTKTISGQSFSTHNDHSKWAVSLSADKPLVCTSDLNRMEHQLHRGGVAVCFVDPTIWATFHGAVVDVQPCPRSTFDPTAGKNDWKEKRNTVVKSVKIRSFKPTSRSSTR